MGMSCGARGESLTQFHLSARIHRLARVMRLCALTLALGTTVGCATATPGARASVSATDDVRAVESVLRSWYDASLRHDSTAYAAPLLPEFFILEDTTRYDRATLLRLVINGFGAGTDRATLSDFNTTVAGDAAWTTFRNEEFFTPNGASALPARRFLETAIFRRVNGQWKLERYHATRINRPAPKT
jgi:ketosteroid isomerase-like protein